MHAEPLVPVAAAARAAGHTVAFFGGSRVVARLVARGFDAIVDPDGATEVPAEITPLVEPDMAHEERVMRERFAGEFAWQRAAPVNAIVTVGSDIDPATSGPQPDHVRVERYIPQAVGLLHCDVVVSHGGSGSTIGALAAGVPCVLLPMGADQPLNAARCEALGAGVALDVMRATPA